jgi:hypothetical protein
MLPLLKTLVPSTFRDAEVPLQPGRPRSHGTTSGNQRRPIAPWRSVEEPQPMTAALHHQAGSRQHCVVVLAWWRRRRRRHSVATRPESPHLHLGSGM